MIFPMYIDGKWFEGEGRQMQDVISPGSGEVLGRIPLGTPEDADAALQAAKKAAPALAAMTVFERAEICYRIANKIDENQEELAKLLIPWLKKNGYNYTFRQLPPINSLRIEVFGITSLSMARK